jgi:glycosyltransferase involved in cell wall biosynthesis
MTVSVIVPTYNGEKKIMSTLKALEKQGFEDFELIVVVDGSTDNTVQLITAQLLNFQKIRVIEQENKGRAGSRNRGASEATGELLIFLDDDTRPLPDCIEIHKKHHEIHNQTIAVGHVPEDYEKANTDFQTYKAFLSRKWAEPLQKNNGLLAVDRPYLTAANFSISRQLFDKIGGFDNRLTDAEDYDFAVRACEMQIKTYFLAEAIAWHDDFLSCRTYIRRLRQYKKSHEELKKLKPGLYAKYNSYEFREIGYLKTMIYNLLSQNFWINLTDKTNFLRILPQPIRYKLYDLITTGLSVYFPERKI